MCEGGRAILTPGDEILRGHTPVLTGDIRISVIVPVYNAQTYLSTCLSGIQAQSFADWECICVDDGSSDDSPSIVEGFAARDNRFRLVRQENGGPGTARNTGLEAARGEYFTFVDADDRVHPQMLERLLLLAEVHRADLVVCDYFRFGSDDECDALLQDSEFSADGGEIEQTPLLPKMVNWRKFRVHPVGKLYQRALHGDLRFPHLYGAEDAYVSFDVYARSKCVVFSRMRFYGYRTVESGLTRSVSKYRNYIVGDAQVAVHGEAVCREHGVSIAVRKQLIAPYVMRMFDFLNQMSIDARLSKKEKRNLVQLAHKGFQDIRRSVTGNYGIVPLVHYIPYSAIRLRALWLLTLWQYIRRSVFPLFRKNRKSSGGNVLYRAVAQF
jgi:glycosyltransferase involved in cell wall biosynthesis